MVTLNSSLEAEVFALRGSRCETCRSEKELLPVQVRFRKGGGIGPLDFIVKCETCLTRREDNHARRDRDELRSKFVNKLMDRSTGTTGE